MKQKKYSLISEMNIQILNLKCLTFYQKTKKKNEKINIINSGNLPKLIIKGKKLNWILRTFY